MQAIQTALQKLEEGGCVDDAKAICEPGILYQTFNWKVKARKFKLLFLCSKHDFQVLICFYVFAFMLVHCNVDADKFPSIKHDSFKLLLSCCFYIYACFYMILSMNLYMKGKTEIIVWTKFVVIHDDTHNFLFLPFHIKFYF